jgi:hypothetical protein
MIENDITIIGVDLASGPDETVFTIYDPVTRRYTLMSKNDPFPPPPAPAPPAFPSEINVLSTESANKLYERIATLDEKIDACLSDINTAVRTVGARQNDIDTMYVKREELAAELDKFAPSQWEPPVAEAPMQAYAPAPGNFGYKPPRFRRRHPFA